MRLVPLSEQMVPAFFEFAKRKRLDYFFFVFDWTYKRKETQILLALNEQNQISGALLTYYTHIVQVRGTRSAVKALLLTLKETELELSAPLDCEEIVQAKYKSPKLYKRITLLSLHKGKEHLMLKHEPEVLGAEAAEELAALMRQVYPDYWSDMTAETLRQMRNETIWLGTRVNGKLVALGVAAFAELGSHILFIGTDAAHRKQGYAASLVSELTKRILERFDVATIFVIDGNTPAEKLYTKMGFRPVKQYLYLKT